MTEIECCYFLCFVSPLLARYQNGCFWPIRRRHNLWACRASFFSILPRGVNPYIPRIVTGKMFVVLLQHMPSNLPRLSSRDYSKCFATGKLFVVLLRHVPNNLSRLLAATVQNVPRRNWLLNEPAKV